MELYTRAFLKDVLAQIPKQSNHEKYIVIYPFAKNHHILLNFATIQFDKDCCCCPEIPLSNIFGAIAIRDVLYILFNNLTLHILHKEGEHSALLLQNYLSRFDRIKIKIDHLLNSKKKRYE